MSVAFADITLPTWLFAAQWALLFALGFLVIIMYRQVGLLEQLKDAGSEREGLPLGEKAPTFDYQLLYGQATEHVRFDSSGRWSLLVFADPTCVSCENTVRALERMAPKLANTTNIIVATTANPAQIAASDAFSSSPLAISRIRDEVSYKLYQTNATPYGYLIDPQGIIRAKGIAGDESAIRGLVHKVDRAVVNVEFVAP